MLGWRVPKGSSKSNSWPCTGQAPESQSHIHMLLEIFKAWGCDHCLGEAVPEPNYSLGEEPYPDAQPKPPLTEVHAIFLAPLMGNLSARLLPPGRKLQTDSTGLGNLPGLLILQNRIRESQNGLGRKGP